MRTYLCCLLMLSFASLAHAQSDSKRAPSDQQKSAASTTAPQSGEANAQGNDKPQEKHASQKDNAAADKDKIYDPGKNGVTFPVAVHIENPEMPEQLRRAHMNDDRGNNGKRYMGAVIVAGYVDKDGRPRDLKIVRSLSKEADKAALDGVKRWKFRPCTLHGQPVNCHLNAEISFKLD